MSDPAVPMTESSTGAVLAGKPSVLRQDEGTDSMLVALPIGWRSEEFDFERYTANPRRSKGTVRVNTAESFVIAVHDRDAPDKPAPTIYADPERHGLIAILNDDRGSDTGWRDYRVELALRNTQEWGHWLSHDGQLLSQEKFAQHMEDGIPELRNPPAADVLDLAQTFHATTAARFKSGRRLASGETQFVYEEEIDAKAGTAGTLAIPSELELELAPFYGSALVPVKAHFRYRLNRDAGLQLGYKIVRPHEVEDAAFATIRDEVASKLVTENRMHLVVGSAPDERRHV